MAVITREPMETLIENTTMVKMLRDGVHTGYEITPNEGYVLHDKSYDTPVYDEITGEETGEIILGYRTSTASCRLAQLNPANGVNTYEFYAVPASSVPKVKALFDRYGVEY